MASTTKHPAILIVFLVIQILWVLPPPASSKSTESTPTPAPWPPQFYALLYRNVYGSNRIVDVWYDWPKRRMINIMQYQLGKLLYDVEWNNGTSFYFTLDSTKECVTRHFEVGVLSPDWLDGAHYLGQRHVDGFLCNVWEKADFLWYYEDVVTKRPVHWRFYDGLYSDVLKFEEGAVLEDEKWQAPVHCFEKGNTEDATDRKSAGSRLESLVNGVLRGIQ